MIFRRPPLMMLIALFALSACGGKSARETLGLSHSAPDEFRVLSRPPLSIPPEFNLLPPDATASGAGTMTPMRTQAQGLVLGEGASVSSELGPINLMPAETSVPVVLESEPRSTAESAFLEAVGAESRNPEIRQTLTQERQSIVKAKEEEGWLDKMMPDKKEKKDAQVDAYKEAERIRDNKDEGKPVTEGETPTVSSGKATLINRILGKE